MEMSRKDFLSLWEKAKQEDILRDGDNQFAYVAGNLVPVDVFYDEEWGYKDGVITCPGCSDTEDVYDTLLDGEVGEWGYKDCLLVCYYRENTYTSMFDFYNNEVTRGFDDWQASWETQYWVVDKEGNASQLEVDSWK